jgi:HD-like signal output (HDOD) protein
MKRDDAFPALAQHVTEVNRHLARPEKTSAGELANTILKDYALTTKLLRLVNSSFYGHYGGRISTVSRAVVVLGFTQVRLAALSLLLLEHIEDKGRAAGLQDTAGRAFFAGALGRRLAETLGLPEPEQAFVCSMFRSLGRYLAVYYLPEEHAEVQRAVTMEGTDEATAARAVLGATFEELGIAVAREWHLPPEIGEAMRALPAGPVPRAEGHRERLRQLSALSNELTDVLVQAEPEARERSVEGLRARFGKSFALPDKDLAQAVEATIADVKTYASSARLDSLKRAACVQGARAWLRGEREAAPGASGEPVSEATQPMAEVPASGHTPETETPYATVVAGIQDITEALLQSYRVNDILVMVLETAYRGLGFSRVLFFVRDAKGCMAARFGLGRDVDELLPRLRFCPSGSADPFCAAVCEQRDQVVSEASSAAQRERLPEWYRRACSSATFVLLPLVVNRVCLGLIYADRDAPGRVVTPAEVGYLHTLRNQAILAVKQRG